jgi:hypothetical protein
MCLAGPLDALGGIGDGLIDIGARSELDAEQHFDGIGKLVGEVKNDGAKQTSFVFTTGSDAITAANIEA